MRYLNLDKVKTGSKLGKDIIYNGSQVLLRSGAILSDNIILKLKEKGFTYVYIDDKLTSDIEIDEVIPQSIKNSLAIALNNVDIDKTVDIAREMTEKIYESRNIAIENYDPMFKDEYQHSLLVADLSVMLGKAIGYNESKLSDLASASLLHDIGKTCVDKKEMEEYGIDRLLKKLGISCTIFQE